MFTTLLMEEARTQARRNAGVVGIVAVIVVGSRGPTAAAIGTAAFLTVALGVLPQAVLVVLGRAAMLMP